MENVKQRALSVVLLVLSLGLQGHTPQLSAATQQDDCERILYLAHKGDKSAIVSAAPDGSRRERLTDWRRWGFSPAEWSPDGRWIAFEKTVNRPFSAIFVMRADGSDKRQLTGSKWWNWNLSWVPDGRSILYQNSATADRYTIRVVDLDGNVRVLGKGTQPALSPDGTTVAFTRAREPGLQYSLWTRPMSGGPATEISAQPRSRYAAPTWSPDGTSITYQKTFDADFDPHDHDWPHADIFTIRPDGSEERRITHLQEDHRGAGYPQWSPDGQQIAYNLEIWEWDFRRAWAHVVDADGSNPVQLTTDRSWGSIWSPDGSRLMFSMRAGPGTWNLYTAAPDGFHRAKVAAPSRWEIYGLDWGGCPAPR